ncbi:non-specific lipid-transfer protein 1-like [Miscanthus floridulus]|uniref:non-specific lipid-transfer protein 1-like n=1 Tax=Miscanthus floridulus TaxID=154761 RepID=UPI00345B1816
MAVLMTNSSRKTVVALAVVLAAALLASSVSAAITCGQVGSSLAPCIPYATGKATALPASCCTGVRSLNSAARTSSDRQAACRCLKSLANSVKSVNMGTVATIPGKCGVSVGFPISMSTDCNKVG